MEHQFTSILDVKVVERQLELAHLACPLQIGHIKMALDLLEGRPVILSTGCMQRVGRRPVMKVHQWLAVRRGRARIMQFHLRSHRSQVSLFVKLAYALGFMEYVTHWCHGFHHKTHLSSRSLWANYLTDQRSSMNPLLISFETGLRITMARTDRAPVFVKAMKEAMHEMTWTAKVLYVLQMFGMMLLLIVPSKLRERFFGLPPNQRIVAIGEDVWQLPYEV
jgi:hypothetical protein